MLFEKPSLRTKLSFDIGFKQIGGHTIYFDKDEVGLGKREIIKDVTKVISSMGNMIMARVFDHNNLIKMTKYSSVPIINGLSDLEHPCQTMADLLTILEVKKSFNNLTIAYIGDGSNNVANSLILACSKLGIQINIGSPIDFQPKQEILKDCNIDFVHIFENPFQAMQNADIVYTDTWVSMGCEAQKEERIKIFGKYQVNQHLMKFAKHDAVFMHDMPAYRGFEVEDAVIDGPQSVIYHQAENRIHAQKAIMIKLLQQFSIS